MAILIVVSHPDDEVLGCGGTAAKLAAAGESVRSCILSGEADARDNRPELAEFQQNTNEAQRLLGFSEPILGSFPNIRLNTIPHIELVQFIESAIVETQADTIFTHHPNDVNDDHGHTSRACQAAARLFQRRTDVKPLKSLYFMEILSATDWTFPSGDAFRADTFLRSARNPTEKIKALETSKE